MMEENRFDELNTILRASRITIIAVETMAVKGTLDLTAEELRDVRNLSEEACEAISNLRCTLEEAGWRKTTKENRE